VEREIGRVPRPIFLAGEWRAGRGRLIRSVDPAEGTINAEVAGASEGDVDEAVACAENAWRTEPWRDLKPHLRATVLHRVAMLIGERSEALALLQSKENGKPIAETRALVASAAGTFRYFAAVIETLEDDITPSRGEFISMSVHEPMGVVGAICPWNSPIASDAQKIAPALAAGNAVLLKPAEATPLVSLELARICEEAGLPKGLLSVLPGPGRIVGERLVTHPRIQKVSFTGGTDVGLRLARLAAEKLMPISLELGGKSPTIVFDDADLDQAVAGVIFGIFSSQGQSCIAGSRLFVHEPIYDEFMQRLVDQTERLKVGHPLEPGVHLGPLISSAHRDSVERYVEMGRDEGGVILAGGARPQGGAYGVYEKGAYYRPTVIAGLENRAKVVREEIFGPVLCALRFASEDDLIEQANDSVYGLACGLWSRDYRRIWRIARAIQAGTIWINTYKMFSISTPFGGLKLSGPTREKGIEGLRGWMNQKSLYWGMSETPFPWAGS